MAESFCGVCRRVVLLDGGGHCRRCKGRQLKPIAEGWAEKSKQEVAARYGLERQAAEAAEVLS